MKPTAKAEAKAEAKEFVLWLVTRALFSNQLLAAKGKLLSRYKEAQDVEKAVGELQRAGCDRNALLYTLAFAGELPRLYPSFNAENMRALARDVKHVLARMKRFTPSVAVAHIDDGV